MSEENNLDEPNIGNEENHESDSSEIQQPVNSEPEVTGEQLNQIKSYQNIYFAFIGGLFVAIICAVLWALITVSSGYQIAYMAIAVGLIVGFSVRFFGAGIDKKFGILGAVLALFGCLLGNLFTQIGFIAKEYSYTLPEVFSYLNISAIAIILIESFNPIDILFYGFAIVEGYKFAFRKITPAVVAAEGNSPNFKYRMPLVIISAVLLCLMYYMFVLKGYNGMKTYTYESGIVMSKGKLKNGKYDGFWAFYHPNGNLMSQGSFYKDLRDSTWSWYNEEGVLEKTGMYKRGVEDGVWKNYYLDGAVYDSVCYIDGRMDGEYISKYESGEIYEKGYYRMGRATGNWKNYYESGQLWHETEMKDDEYTGDWFAYFEDGKVSEQRYYDRENLLLINLFDDKGNQLVKDGNGHYVLYAEDGKTVLLEGEYEKGLKVGEWKSYYSDGKLNEEAVFENNIDRMINYWSPAGEQLVKDGNGLYKSYWDENQVYETGLIKDGLREGRWLSYTETGLLMFEQDYLAGKESGEVKTYFASGSPAMEGEYENGKRTGQWIWYNEDGTLSSSVKFVDDKKEGEQLIYDISGILVKEEMYKAGELVDIKLMY